MRTSPIPQTEPNGRSAEVAALLAAARAVLENRAFTDAARAILAACRTILGAEAGVVALRAADATSLEVVVLEPGRLALDPAAGLPPPLRRLSARAAEGRAVFANGLSKRKAKAAAAGRRSVPESALLAPILLADEVEGLLGLLDKPGGFSAADSRLAEVFAGMAAVALLESRTVDGLEKNRDALEEEVRQGARQLHQAEEQFRTLVDTLPDFVARFDPDLRHLYVSPAIELLTGRPARDFLGKTNRESGLPSELTEVWDAALGKVFATGRPEVIELELPAAGGTRHFDCRLVPEPQAGGAIPSVLSVARDVTDRWLTLAGMQSLARRLVEAQENERRHIARELHDEAGQVLVSLRYGLRLLEKEIDAGAAVSDRVTELVQKTDAVIDGLHRLAADLRPASLDHLGLEAALRQYSRSAATGLTVRFKARGLAGERLPAMMETALYRVVQEAMTNVMRHACATRVDVLAQRCGERVLVMVEDDGVGFELGQARRGDHLGLLGMRERAEALGGTLTVESSPGAGTTVVVEVPCPSAS